ncbi:MAG TPA: APC family permease [Micropepsaceae bacterium]|nr:APC family permease [Micropepsaceae bacterium]
MAKSEPTSLAQFGYAQELKRSLSLFDLVVYGLVSIDVISPFSIFGLVFNASHGMVPFIYVVGIMAMAFTAMSYATMSRAFPMAGSVYSYAGRGIGEVAGFIAGWAILLDYILIPTLVYVVCAIAIQTVIPSVPRFVWIVLILSFNTAVALSGIEPAARMNRLFLFLQLAFLTLFVVLAGIAIAHGVAHLSAAPFFQPGLITPGLIFGSLSIAVLSFLGFDGISTLAEEARGDALIGRATLIALFAAGALFILQTYIASLFVGVARFPPGEATDAAFYNVAGAVGGPAFKFIAALSKVLFAGAAVALAAQVATARLLFGMARDRKLPRFLSHVHPRRKVPDRAIIFVAIVTLLLGFALANQLELLTSMVNFGALTGFLMLHASVIVHFVWRQRSRVWLRHLVAPLVGFTIVAYVLLNMAAPAKIAGLAWLAIGIAGLIGLKLTGRRATLPA